MKLNRSRGYGLTRQVRLLLGLVAPVTLVCLLSVPQRCAGADEAAAWQTRRAQFDYDKSQALNATSELVAEGGRIVEERIEFDSPLGGRVAGAMVRPREGGKPRVLLLLHGFGGSKQDAMMVGVVLAGKGWATLGLDAAGHGDRKMPKEAFLDPDTGAAQKAMIQTVVDYRRALDYLETREDLDSQGVGLIGASMGAMMGTLLAAVDDRISAALLIVGGGAWEKMVEASDHPVAVRFRERLADPVFAEELSNIDPVNYVAHIAPRPVWMLNGRQDQIVPPACAEALHAAACEPKRVVWYDGGHIPDISLAIRVLNEWIDQWMTTTAAAQ